MARKVSAANFVAFLQERLAAKDGYIFGATGQNPRKLSAWYFNQYEGKQRKKALYWRQNAQRVWDCNGLAEGYYKQVTGVDINARARDNYRSWCKVKGEGKIPAKYRVPGAAVFKRSGYIHHVGFLVRPVNAKKPGGDWYVIEARGVMTGVIRSRLNANNWNCWGLMTKYFDYGAAASAPEAAPPATGKKALRPGDRGKNVKKLQKLLAALGERSDDGVDGVYGPDTEAAVRKWQKKLGLPVNGIYDEDTHRAVMRELAKEGEGEVAPAKEDVRGDRGDEEGGGE